MTTTAPAPGGQHFVLDGVSWDYYDRTLRELERQHRHVRVTYDRGRLEFMTLTSLHEFIKKTMGRLVETLSVERGIPATGLGSLTCRREDLDRGLEPDECYYVATPPPPAEAQPIDLTVHPPPDLAIEVDISASSVPRQPIYGALGVPEVWRFDGQAVLFLRRQSDGRYVRADESLAFPGLTPQQFNRFLLMALPNRQFEAVVAFRDWLRQGAP
jgi:Uma2 family endonuclease